MAGNDSHEDTQPVDVRDLPTPPPTPAREETSVESSDARRRQYQNLPEHADVGNRKKDKAKDVGVEPAPAADRFWEDDPFWEDELREEDYYNYGEEEWNEAEKPDKSSKAKARNWGINKLSVSNALTWLS